MRRNTLRNGVALALAVLALASSPAGAQRRPERAPIVVEQVEGEEYERNQRWFHAQRAFPFGTIPPNARRAAWEHWKRIEPAAKAPRRDGRARAAGPSAADARVWRSIGPAPTAAAIGAISPVSGRIRALAVSPVDPNVVLVGSAVGGVWRSEDGGATFAATSDDQVDLAVGAIAFAPSAPATVYAAMGQEYLGSGVLKSTDAGRTWARVSGDSLPTPGLVEELIVDPANANRLYAAQYAGLAEDGVLRASGLQVSTDSGATWSRTLAGLARDAAIDPTDPRIVYAAMARVDEPGDRPPGVYRSTDNGRTWALAWTSPFQSSFHASFTVAVAPSDANRVYIHGYGAINSAYTTRIAVSNDRGRTWDVLGASDLRKNESSFLVVSHADRDTVYVGFYDSDAYRSTNGGVSWECLTKGYCDGRFGSGDKTHVDQHCLALSPVDANRVLLGNDGGLYASPDRGETWQSLNATLSLVTFRSIAIHPNFPTLSFGGTQDNGTQRRTDGSSAWQEIITGDGGQIVFNPLDPSTFFTTYIYGTIFRWRSDGLEYDGVVAGDTTFGEPEGGPRIAFYPPFTGDGATKRLYFGTWRLFVSDDLGETWSSPASQTDLTRGSQDVLSAIGVGPATPAVIYTGSSEGRVMVSSDAGRTWRQAGGGLPERFVTSIVVDRANSNVAYLTMSGFRAGHVFKTVDQGATWRDVSGLLPDVPANAILQDPLEPNTLYVGTDIGVFRSTSAGAAWEGFNEGMPPAVVLGFSSHSSGVVQAATYGRGAYELAAGSGTTPDYSLAFGPAEVVVARGSRATATLTATRVNGLEGAIDVTAPESQPRGIKVKPARGKIDASGLAVTVKARRSAAPGRYDLVFSARSASGLLRTGTLVVIVE